MTATVPLNDWLSNPRRAFVFLVLYRWISLIPPAVSLLLLISDGRASLALLGAGGLAVLLNALISVFHVRLNRELMHRPWLLGIDLALAAVLIALSGGWQTPYYLYALSPLLAAAFFFQLRGAFWATTAFSPAYLAAVVLDYQVVGDPPNWLVVIMAIIGFYLISATFGYSTALVERLQVAGVELTDAHRDLEVIHDLTLSLQSATDVNEVEERVVQAITTELHYEKAIVALADESQHIITSWVGRARQGAFNASLAHFVPLPLSPEGGLVSQALLEGRIHISAKAPFTTDETINEQLAMQEAHIFPLVLRERPVGILLVNAGGSRDHVAGLHSLQAIANQAAVSLGATMLCVDRAQRMAVQEERVRIARDIHDTVSQSLFGIVFTLDGCLKLLPEHPEAVEPELKRVLAVAEETRAEVRKSILDIWPSTLTATRFESDLETYTAAICQADDLELDFRVGGDFSLLSPRARRSLYRISQEALANIAHHANASRAQVCVDIVGDRAILSIQDNGQGFDPEQALKRVFGREHFGLLGMQERAESLGGTCEINSQPGAGTTIMVDIPLSGQPAIEDNQGSIVSHPAVKA